MQQAFIFPHKQRSPSPGMNAVTLLITLNVVFFVLFPGASLWQLALSADGFRHFRFWQIISYMFLHGNFVHLLLNMWGLYLFGNHVYRRLGTQRFLMLYFLSGISGSLLWLLFNWNSPSSVIGSSGAVFGVMMAAAVLSPERRMMLLFPPIPVKLKTLVFVFAGIEILSELSNLQGGVAHLAHLGGFLGAYLYMGRLSGATLLDMLKSPFSGVSITGSSPRQSSVNRQTFERIMAEIEEIEKEENRKQSGHPDDRAQ